MRHEVSYKYYKDSAVIFGRIFNEPAESPTKLFSFSHLFDNISSKFYKLLADTFMCYILRLSNLRKVKLQSEQSKNESRGDRSVRHFKIFF